MILRDADMHIVEKVKDAVYMDEWQLGNRNQPILVTSRVNDKNRPTQKEYDADRG